MEVMKKYYENNSLKSIFYMNDALHFHNDNGPAIVGYYEDGTLSSEYIIGHAEPRSESGNPRLIKDMYITTNNN